MVFQHFLERFGLALQAGKINQFVTGHKEGCFDLLAYQLMPLDFVEHLIFLEVAKRATQPGLRVFAEQQGNEGVNHVVLHVLGELEGVL